jgi:hypothetical protein
MSGSPWAEDPIVLGRLERLNDAYARGEIELDELEQRTAEVIDRGHQTPPHRRGRSARPLATDGFSRAASPRASSS